MRSLVIAATTGNSDARAADSPFLLKAGQAIGVLRQGPKAEPTPAPSPDPPWADPLRLPQALSAYQGKPDILSRDQTWPSFPANLEPSWEHRSQGPYTTGQEHGLQVPSLGARCWQAPPARGRGVRLITRSLRTRVKWSDFPGGPAVKNSPANARDRGSIHGLGRLHMPQGS